MTSLLDRVKRVQHPVVRVLLLRARSIPHLVLRGHLVRRRRVGRYLSTAKQPKLQIGAGPLGRGGWLNTDLICGDVYIDLTRRLALPDSSFSYIFGEHVIEHLTATQGISLLRELHRILRPGGVLRLVTPDLRKIIALYEDRNPEIARSAYVAYFDSITAKTHMEPAEVFNDYLRLWGHLHVYDEPNLVAYLGAAGFRDVVRVEPGTSSHLELQGLESHGGAAWVNRAEAICLEATRGPSG